MKFSGVWSDFPSNHDSPFTSDYQSDYQLRPSVVTNLKQFVKFINSARVCELIHRF